MAIAYDTSTNSTYKSSSSGYTWSHTCTGSNGYLVVGIMIFNAAAVVTAATYNGVAMTALLNVSNSSGPNNLCQYLFGLKNPSTGSNTVSITLNSSYDSIGLALSFTGVDQTNPNESNNNVADADSGTSTGDVDLTTSVNNDWILCFTVTNAGGSITEGGGQTGRQNVSGASGIAGVSTRGPVTPAGTYSSFWTNSPGVAVDWLTTAMCLSPFVAPTFNPAWASSSNWIIQGISAP